MKILKRLFCKHDYKVVEGNVPIRYPHWEPIQFLQKVKCIKCDKTIEVLSNSKYPYDFEINEKIQEYKMAMVLDTDYISDGHHTFGELYKHRCYLFAVICNSNKNKAWKSKKHSDGTMYDGMFIVGITTPNGEATYHYDMKFWELFDVKEILNAPEYDGYTPDDVLERLLTL